jgi:hypothetical protein
LLETNRLTANELAKLARHEALPSPAQVKAFAENEEYRRQLPEEAKEEQIYALAKQYLRNNEVEKAWLCLLQLNNQSS